MVSTSTKAASGCLIRASRQAHSERMTVHGAEDTHMSDIYIVNAVRTPVGKFRGSLAGVRADHLGALVIQELVRRAGVPADAVDDVILGCVTQIGEQSANIARTSLLGAGWPVTIPGLTIDRKCGSGEAAVHVAAGAIASGAADVVGAGGAGNMSRVPMGSNRDLHGEAFGWMASERYELTGQGEAAEHFVARWKLTREELDAFSVESHRRPAAAADAGWFTREIVPVPVGELREKSAEGEAPVFSGDETIRPGTKAEKLATLKTSFRAEGRITAGNSSQISDGAAGLLVMSADAVKRFGVKPRGRIRAAATVGAGPTPIVTRPNASTRQVLAQAGLKNEDIQP